MVTAQSYIKRQGSVIALACALLVSTAAMATEDDNKAASGAWYSVAEGLEDGKTMAQCFWSAARVSNQDTAFHMLSGDLAVKVPDKKTEGNNTKDVYCAKTDLKGAFAYSMMDATIDTLENGVS